MLREKYVTTAEAAEMLGRGANLIAKLCQAGRLPGAEKIGNTWMIPRESVENYTPMKQRGRTKAERRAAELACIRAELAEIAKEEQTA